MFAVRVVLIVPVSDGLTAHPVRPAVSTAMRAAPAQA